MQDIYWEPKGIITTGDSKKYGEMVYLLSDHEHGLSKLKDNDLSVEADILPQSGDIRFNTYIKLGDGNYSLLETLRFRLKEYWNMRKGKDNFYLSFPDQKFSIHFSTDIDKSKKNRFELIYADGKKHKVASEEFTEACDRVCRVLFEEPIKILVPEWNEED